MNNIEMSALEKQAKVEVFNAMKTYMKSRMYAARVYAEKAMEDEDEYKVWCRRAAEEAAAAEAGVEVFINQITAMIYGN